MPIEEFVHVPIIPEAVDGVDVAEAKRRGDSVKWTRFGGVYVIP